MTINPSDLQNPLLLILAGAQYCSDSFPKVTPAVCGTTAVSDQVVVARFFHFTFKGILDGLLGSKPDEPGILGNISNYFGVVESNGSRMLYVHTLI